MKKVNGHVPRHGHDQKRKRKGPRSLRDPCRTLLATRLQRSYFTLETAVVCTCHARHRLVAALERAAELSAQRRAARHRRPYAFGASIEPPVDVEKQAGSVVGQLALGCNGRAMAPLSAPERTSGWPRLGECNHLLGRAARPHRPNRYPCPYPYPYPHPATQA